MFKLLSLLAAGMFLTFLIGGEDRGQSRQGLIGVAQNPAERPVLREAKATPVKVAPAKAEAAKATPAADVAQISFTPTKVQKPARATSTIAGEFVLSEPKKIVIAQPVALPAPVVPDAAPIMYVRSPSVNVRQGPSTDYEVVGRLVRAEAVSVIAPEQDGWVRIAIEGDGLEGFIAARLLTDIDPSGN